MDPAENGMDLFFYLKNDLKITIPIIIISIISDTERVRKLMNSGAAKWLKKGTLLPNDLKIEVKKIINND
jgi:hypothetical protein